MSYTAAEFFNALLQSSIAFLIVLNPIGLVPIVASLTGDLEDKQQKRIIRDSVLIGALLLLTFAFAGTLILSVFGITLNDLKVAGGLLLLSIAFSFVLRGSINADTKIKSGPSAGPIASPILVGPGAITTAVVLNASYSNNHSNAVMGALITALAVAVASFVTWIVFRSTKLVYKFLGESGADVIVRIMGILLAAIAVVHVRQGIVNIIHMTK